jgi:hypothetical protein
MPTINSSKAGYIIGQSSTSFSTARQNGSSAVPAPTTSTDNALRYRVTSGRGSLTHAFYRTFLYFDTSGITTPVSSATIDIMGAIAGTADYIVLKSSAFGGDGGTALTTSDFYSEVDYSTPYTSEITSWSRTSTNNITLGATAKGDMKNDTAFIVALVEYDSDYLNTAGVVALDVKNGIAFGTTITLTYTALAATSITSVNTITKSNITSYNTIAASNIDELNTLTF